MKNRSLKAQATKGIIWSTVDNFALQAVQFVVGIILARLLMPKDFGLIGMLSIFIAVSQSFIDSGMGSGLIQKQNRTNLDYSTVFVFNFTISVVFYSLLYTCAPYIANFYSEEKLTQLTRVLGLNIIISSLAIVQRTKLKIDLDFKSLAKVNIISVLISGIIALVFAFKGFGVWALVIQNLIFNLLTVVCLWIFSYWQPSLSFSKKSFIELFGFSSKLLISDIYAQTFRNANDIAIGRAFNAADLGYFTRARGFADITAGTVSSIMFNVSYPILASIQNDKMRLVSVFRKLIRMTAFIIIPSMILLAILAEPIITLLLTEKWNPSIVLLQWMCLARLFYPLSILNMNILNAIGRSDLFLKVDLAKFPFLVIALIITIPISVKAMTIGMFLTSVISFTINTYMPGKFFGYGIFAQFKDMAPMLIISGVAGIATMIVSSLVNILILKIILGFIIFTGIYLGLSYILKIKEINEIKILLFRKTIKSS